jgi:MFS family permease
VNPYERPSKSHSAQLALTLLFCAALVGVYVGLMRTLISVSRLTSDTDIERRDEAYALVHLGVLAIAAVSGFLLGRWFNGLGLAYALLFVIVVAISMLALLLGSYELACAGHNDILRHWQCGPS